MYCVVLYEDVAPQFEYYVDIAAIQGLFFCIPRWINTCAWCVAVGLLRTVCFCVMAVMTAITPSV